MITRVVLKNFQNHSSLDLEVGPLTALSGPTSSGKTAVVRAIAGLLRNDPGKELIQAGKDVLSVTLHLDSGFAVTWRKGQKAVNEYIIEDPEGTQKKFQNVGAKKVPDEVMDLLRIGPLTLEDGTKVHLNLHEQMDPLFLLKDPAPLVAKITGELTSAGRLLFAAAAANKSATQMKKLRTVREQDTLKLKEEFSEFPDLEHFASQLELVEKFVVHKEKVDCTVNTLRSLGGKHQQELQAREKMSKLLEKLGPAREVDLSAVRAVVQEKEALVSVLAEHDGLTKQNQKAEALLEKLSPGLDIDLSKPMQLVSAAKKMSALANAYTKSQGTYEQYKVSLAQAQEELAGISEELGKIAVCPTCGQEVPHDESSC